MIIGKGGEAVREMQEVTNCKINVSQPSGRDIEREIELIGFNSSIQQAEAAIWEKVRAVVCFTLVPHPRSTLTPCSRKRMPASAAHLRETIRLICKVLQGILLRSRLKPYPLVPLNLQVERTHMLPTGATRLTLRSGTQPKANRPCRTCPLRRESRSQLRVYYVCRPRSIWISGDTPLLLYK